MEEGAIRKPHETRQKAKMNLARSETFPPTSHHQRASPGQAINQQKSSSFPSFPTHSDQGASFIQQHPYVSNFESDSLTNHRQVANAGDASLEALWPLFVKIQPSLSSLLQDLVNWEAARLLPAPKFDEPQETSSYAKTPQEELEQIVSEEPSNTNWGERTLDEYLGHYARATLVRAAMKGDWPAAKVFLERYPEYVRAPITKEGGTALHVAVVAQRTTFTKELLKLMDPFDLELRTIQGVTALHVAAQSGIVTIAEQLVELNDKLLLIHDSVGRKPLLSAIQLGHKNMVFYLFSVTPLEQLTPDERAKLLLFCISNDFYDIALGILERDPYIATADNQCGWNALKELAKKPLAIGSETRLSICKSLLNSWFKGIFNKDLMKTKANQLVEILWKMTKLQAQFFSNLAHYEKTLIFNAAKVGNVEFLIILIRYYPDLIWLRDEDNMSLFHIAIVHRQESVFNLIYEIGSDKNTLASYITFKEKNNMLHLAAQLAPSDRLNIVTRALSMQRELLWFKEIEKLVPPSYMNMKNLEGFTPRELFRRTHEKLQIDGEKWMKSTSNSCMIVATLIAIVVFAAAFTVPGGNNQETGTPIFLLRSNWFMVFFISDAIAMCSSSTSILIFLSMFASRYTEEDFYRSVPSKLLFGLTTLFISVVGMMVAFTATCFLAVYSTRAWATVVVITLASIPVTSFVVLHRELWVDTILSTCKSGFIFRPHKHRLF